MLNDPIQQHVILFDGVCNLCNGTVLFVLKREKQPVFQFAALQSAAAKELLEQYGLPKDYNQTVLLIEGGKLYLGSTAALKIGQTLKFPWSFLSQAGFLVPKFIRDWVYGQIAEHRYQWFGKREVCMVPTKNLKERFL